MKRKKIIAILCTIYMIIVFSVVTIIADDSNDNEKINNLNLNTEILNNKKEEVNSNTTIDDVKLFSSDYKTILENEIMSKDQYYNSVYEYVFTNKVPLSNEQQNSINVFENKIVFDKNIVDRTENYNFMPIFFVIVLTLMVLTYVFTKRNYLNKSRKEDNDANYNNIYEQ